MYGEISLADLTAVYPDVDDPELPNKLASKYEFQQLSDKVDILPGELFPAQEIVKRLLSDPTPNSDLALIWPTGKGKSRAVLEIAKKYKDYPMQYGDKDNNQKILIIAKRSIKDVWVTEISKIPEFMDDFYDKHYDDKKIQRKERKKIIDKYFDIRPQDKFANELAVLSNDKIRETYSRPMIIIDEAHTLKTDVDPNYDEEGIVTNTPDIKKAYVQIRRLMQLARGSVKIIVTATPMSDKPYDIISTLSFLLPPEKIRGWNINNFNVAYGKGDYELTKYLYEHLNGRLSVVSSNRTVPYIKMGETFQRIVNGELYQSKMRVIEIPMRKTQYNIYLRHATRDMNDEHYNDDGDFGEDVVNEAFAINSRKAMNFIFIDIYDRSGASDGIKFEYFRDPQEPNNNKDGFIIINPPLQRTEAERLRIGNERRQDRMEREAARERQREDESSGKAGRAKKSTKRSTVKEPHRFKFRYNDIPVQANVNPKINYELAFDLEPRPAELNFGDPLPPRRLEFIRNMSCKAAWLLEYIHYDIDDIPPGWVRPIHDIDGEVGNYGRKIPKGVILNQNDVQPFIPTANYPEWRGEACFAYHPWIRDGGGIPFGVAFEFMGYERYIGNDGFSSDVVTNLSNKPRFAYMTGNPGSTGPRNNNIKDILNAPENKYGLKIMVVFASDVAATGLSFLNFRKYAHLGPAYTLYRQSKGRTIRLDSHKNFPEERRFVKTCYLTALTPDGHQTIDHEIWYRIESKLLSIKKVEKILKRIAVDCTFNKRIKAAQPELCIGSMVDVEGRPIAKPELDFTTYHLHWAQQEFDEIEYKIRSIYKVASKFTIDDIYNILAEHNIQTIVWCLTRMVSAKEIILDRFGFKKMLREQNGVYYLSNVLGNPETDTKDTLGAENYDYALHYYSDNMILPFEKRYEIVANEMLRNQFQSTDIPNSLNEFKYQWYKYDSDRRMLILERALLNNLPNSDIRMYVLKDLQPVWFIFNDCIFHYFNQMKVSNGGGYQNNRQKIGDDAKLRIFCKGDSNFSDVNPLQQQIYVNMINARWVADERSILERMPDISFVGIWNVSSDGGFRIKIIDNSAKGNGNRGKAITHFDEPLLISWLWEINHASPEVAEASYTQMLAEIRSKLTGVDPTNWSKNKVTFYYRWLQAHSRPLNEVFDEDTILQMERFLSSAASGTKPLLIRHLFNGLKQQNILWKK